MRLPEDAKLLRVFVGEADKHQGKPLFEVIVQEARRTGLSGATVFRGILGYGAHSRVHSEKILRLSEDMPLIVEIVDTQEKIDAFLPFLDTVMKEGLITLEKAQVIAYRHRSE